MSRGLLSLVPIFAGCSPPFLDSLSVLLHEVTSQGTRPLLTRVRHGGSSVAWKECAGSMLLM